MNNHVLEQIRWASFLQKAADSPYGIQLKPQEAQELSELLGGLVAEVKDMHFQLGQAKLDALSTPICEKCALNGGKHVD